MRPNTFEGMTVSSELGKVQSYGSYGGWMGGKGEEPLSGFEGVSSCVSFEGAGPLGQNGFCSLMSCTKRRI